MENHTEYYMSYQSVSSFLSLAPYSYQADYSTDSRSVSFLVLSYPTVIDKPHSPAMEPENSEFWHGSKSCRKSWFPWMFRVQLKLSGGLRWLETKWEMFHIFEPEGFKLDFPAKAVIPWSLNCIFRRFEYSSQNYNPDTFFHDYFVTYIQYLTCSFLPPATDISLWLWQNSSTTFLHSCYIYIR